ARAAGCDCVTTELTSDRLEVPADLRAFYEYSLAQGFGDGLPLFAPTEDAVRALLAGAGAPNALTCRERDILASVALGHSVRQTAQTLGIAVKTVQSVQRQLFSKLGARNRLDALNRARDLHLVSR
ncbi:helix-turn-helix transcriptional regulator, partial [Actinophytocola sp.]|uniref:helix-turn-helix domain-containing protein n=1 Tax=Actinophytocola sp. TaxID=1872138 RepID=UPI002D7F9E9A